MATTDPRIDAYMAKAGDFAKPVLEHLRKLVHKACPGVEETIKWGFPHFDYQGNMLCAMAAFKQHCAFGFWKASLLKDPEGVLERGGNASAGSVGRIMSKKDLPADKILIAYIKEAVSLNETGVKLPARKKSAPKKEGPIPPVLAAALKKNKKAQAAFDAFPPSHRREYIAWIDEAKTEETQLRRVATALEWIAEGKARNWKYQKK
jgi:uncharacterized protein YdeI (YjbR/CyaY-like superfamily)